MDSEDEITNLIELYRQGLSLSEEEASHIEKQVATQPITAEIAKLLGYYATRKDTQTRRKFVELLQWIIETRPASELAWLSITRARSGQLRSIEPNSYESLKKAWFLQSEAAGQNVRIILNAADFCQVNGDLHATLTLLQQAQNMHPDDARITEKIAIVRKRLNLY